MDKVEFLRFAQGIKTFYSREQNLLPNEEAMELWYRALQDIPIKVAMAFFNKWVMTEKWSPSVADIRKGCAEVLNPEITDDWSKGWNECIRAIGKYGYMREAEALASMSEKTRETVRCLGWRSLCMSENEMADRANFRQVYESVQKRQVETEALPETLKKALFQLADERKMLE